MKIYLTGFAVVLSAVVPLTWMGWRGPSQDPVPISGSSGLKPPAQCWPVQARLRPSSHVSDELQATVSLDTASRRLRLDWGWLDASGTTGRASQAFELTYWPMAAQEFAGDLIVAGVRPRDGHTVIERWSLIYPSPGYAGEDYSVTLGAVSSLYDARQVGRSGVRFLRRLERAAVSPTSLLVQFSDSNDLYVLDVTTGVLSLLWDAQAVTHLKDARWKYVTSAEHSTHGYVYSWHASEEAAVIETLVALDVNKDGTVESWLFLNNQQWISTMGGSGAWVQFFDQ